jgi:predicted MFS family arabinose efflux permease
MNLWKGLNKLPRSLWMLSAAALINRTGTMVLPFMAIYLNKAMHLSIAESGLVLTVYGIAALITAPVVGKLVDWLSPFRVMKYSLFLSGILLFVFPYIEHYSTILIVTFIWSVLNEAFRPANMVLIGNLAETDQRRLAFSLNRLAINLGMSIGPVIGGILFVYNYNLLFYIDGATSLLSCLFLLTVKINVNKNPSGSVETEKTDDNSSYGKETIKQKRLILFLFAFIPVMLVFFQNISTMPIYLTRELNYKETFYGFMFAINTVMIIFMEVPLQNYLVKYSNLRLMSIGALFVAFGFGSMVFAKSIPLLVLTVVLWTIGEMIIFPSSAAYISDISPEKKKGQYMGFYQMASNAAFTLGPWLGTLAYENYGSSFLWGGTFVLAFISAISIGMLSRRGIKN